MTHTCNWDRAWPTGHPIPPEDPAKLQGPEVGQIVRYRPRNESYSRLVAPNGLVRIKAQSYVWSPGECSAKGGYRHYDWKVIEWPEFNRDGTVGFHGMVVDDVDLQTL